MIRVSTLRTMNPLRRMIPIAACCSVAACASAPTPKPVPYQTGASVAAPPSLPPATSGPIAAHTATNASGSPPSMGPGQPSMVGMPSLRVSVSASNEEVSDVITRVARQVGLSAIIDPGVRGPITRTMREVTLNDAMMSLVGNQYQYQVRNGALIVSPVQLIQHTYTVDYVTMSRISSGTTQVSRGTNASGADVIQSSSQVDVWGELALQLESIVFGATMGPQPVNPRAATPGTPSYQRCDAGGACLRISPITSLIDVTATPEKQEEVARYLGLFSAAIGRQVNIKAQVVEVSLDRSHNFGIDWQAVFSTAKGLVTATSNPGASFVTDPTSGVTGSAASFNLGFGDFTLQAVLNALETVGNVEVVAKPMTNALNQQKASFHVTRQEQFFTITRVPIISPVTGAVTGYTESPILQTTTVGLVFDVVPQISDRNVVMMSIRPSVTSLTGRTTVQSSNGDVQASLPITEHRESDTMARVRSGETIMIGGLIRKQLSTTRTGVPLLMHIPGIGRLFSSTKIEERNSELVIFLTPEIISGQPPGGR